jgi:O-antigen/teichoic acid export membrane protein
VILRMDPVHRPHLGLNVVANYVGKLWGFASIYVFVPIYVSLLGIDAYGLIAFNSILLAIMFIADAGLSSAFSREAARQGSGRALLDLLTSVERALFGILLTVGVVFILAVPNIASSWLNTPPTVPPEHVVQSLWLMGISFIPQIAMSLYFGGLMGLQRQVSANLLWTSFSVARSGLVVLPIYFFSDVRVFFAWQAMVSMGMVLLMRRVLLEHITKPLREAPRQQIHGQFSLPALQGIKVYAVGMLGMSVISAFNMQMDKLVVSKMLPLAEFALYSLASTLAQIPHILTLPIAAALLPRFTNLIEQPNRREDLVRLYRDSSYYVACTGAIAGLGLALFMPEVFALWMPAQPVDHETINAARLLALGGFLLTLQVTPFQLSLAHGHQSTVLRLGICMLLISAPLQVILTSRFGVLGAAVPWVLLNLVAFVYLGVRLNRRFPLVSVRRWASEDVFVAILPALLLLLVARFGAEKYNAGPLFSCALATLAALVAFGISYVLRRLRRS